MQISNEALEALRDDDDWRKSGQPPREKIWNLYKSARNPSSYRYLTRPTWIKILNEHGFDDPCPINQEEWAKQDPEGARQLEKAKARVKARNRL